MSKTKKAQVEEVIEKAAVEQAMVEVKAAAEIAQIKDPTIMGSIKDFFKRSETIFYARLQVVVGFVIAALGAMNLSPIYALIGESAGFTSRQVIALGGFAVFNGVITELARRRNAAL